MYTECFLHSFSFQLAVGTHSGRDRRQKLGITNSSCWRCGNVLLPWRICSIWMNMNEARIWLQQDMVTAVAVRMCWHRNVYIGQNLHNPSSNNLKEFSFLILYPCRPISTCELYTGRSKGGHTRAEELGTEGYKVMGQKVRVAHWYILYWCTLTTWRIWCCGEK